MRSGIQPVPLVAGRYATSGMISPTGPPLVDPTTGNVSPIGFRFLHSMFQRINNLEQALINAGIPIPTVGE